MLKEEKGKQCLFMLKWINMNNVSTIAPVSLFALLQKPLYVITENVIIWLMLSQFTICIR